MIAQDWISGGLFGRPVRHSNMKWTANGYAGFSAPALSVIERPSASVARVTDPSVASLVASQSCGQIPIDSPPTTCARPAMRFVGEGAPSSYEMACTTGS